MDGTEIPARALIDAATNFGTPIYVTDLAQLRQSAEEVRKAFPDPWIRQYSLKANDVPAIVREVATAGFGANVVSRGEWALASQAEIPNDRITLEGIGKTDDDLRAAARAAADGAPLRWIALESADETAALAGIAAEIHQDSGRRLDVLLRLNPEVEPETIPGLAVGARSSKFGMRADELMRAIDAGGGPDGPLRWVGIHLHTGSQLSSLKSWQTAVGRALAVYCDLRERLTDFHVLDIGGGFPVGDSPRPSPREFAGRFAEAIEAISTELRPTRLAIEPGRYLVARAGFLVARVLHVRDGRGPTGQPAVVLDAGMTEIIRPALYGAHHPIVALTSNGAADGHSAGWETVVEGPVCESTDRLGTHLLPPLRRGDLVAILDAGAYASSMSSRYNGRPRPAELFIEDGRVRLVRAAEPPTRP